MSWATPVSMTDRVRQTRRLLASEGSGGVSRRLRRRVAERLVPMGSQPLPISADDIDRVEDVARAGWAYPAPPIACPDEPMSVAWVCAPPGPGSGGHTTMFRLVAGLERAGHRCTVYLHDRHGWSTDQHTETIRAHWPRVRAEVRDLAGGIVDCDAIVATSWPTAYAVAASPAAGRRVYLVQDFEPLFSAAGSEYLLAESTYRFGFHGLTAGRWLAARLSSEYGMPCDHFDFASDPGVYRIDDGPGAATARDGVVYYCRPETPRRAHELALMALERFANQHPETPIHTYGSVLPSLPFAATQHGVLSPTELSALYNRCIAGLSLSATNVSLVPLEMLAAGCVPVVNDAEHTRVVLENDEVRYAPATPWDLAQALSELVDQSEEARERRAGAAAGSVRELSWSTVEDRVTRILERIVREARVGVH